MAVDERSGILRNGNKKFSVSSQPTQPLSIDPQLIAITTGSRSQHSGDSNGSTVPTMEQASEGDVIDFLKDRPEHMTYGRRIALSMASKFAWYNPHLGKANGPDGQELPSLAKAWAYFEHVTLERYVVEDYSLNRQVDLTKRQRLVKKFHRGERQMNIAEPGERELPTKLYSPITTPLSQMGDFGLGYGLYFSTLRSYAILSFLIGILNLPNLIYFASDEYSKGQNEIATTLKGSAICTGTHVTNFISLSELEDSIGPHLHRPLFPFYACKTNPGLLARIVPTSMPTNAAPFPGGEQPMF